MATRIDQFFGQMQRSLSLNKSASGPHTSSITPPCSFATLPETEPSVASSDSLKIGNTYERDDAIGGRRVSDDDGARKQEESGADDSPILSTLLLAEHSSNEASTAHEPCQDTQPIALDDSNSAPCSASAIVDTPHSMPSPPWETEQIELLDMERRVEALMQTLHVVEEDRRRMGTVLVNERQRFTVQLQRMHELVQRERDNHVRAVTALTQLAQQRTETCERMAHLLSLAENEKHELEDKLQRIKSEESAEGKVYKAMGSRDAGSDEVSVAHKVNDPSDEGTAALENTDLTKLQGAQGDPRDKKIATLTFLLNQEKQAHANTAEALGKLRKEYLGMNHRRDRVAMEGDGFMECDDKH